jgi:hypothetical protein
MSVLSNTLLYGRRSTVIIITTLNRVNRKYRQLLSSYRYCGLGGLTIDL